MPLVLLLSECDHRDLPRERSVPIGLRIVEHDLHLMGMIVVLVDEQQGPLTVGTVEGISRH